LAALACVLAACGTGSTSTTVNASAAYNLVMAEVLAEHGIEMVEVPRLEAGGQPVSASRVRAAWRAGDRATLKDLVPPATLAYLLEEN